MKTGNWIGHILGRNCLLKSVVEGKIGRKGRRRRRRKQLMYEDTETCKRKHYNALCNDFAFEDAINLSKDRLRGINVTTYALCLG